MKSNMTVDCTFQKIVPPECHGQRIDVFLTLPYHSAASCPPALDAGDFPSISRAMAQKLLADGHVTLHRSRGPAIEEGQRTQAHVSHHAESPKVAKNYKVTAGDIITCYIPPPTETDTTPEDIPLDIIYEDDHLLVINKPRGLVVHPGAGNWHGTLVNALLHHCELSSIGGVLRPGIVHRLDKDTSGLIVVAKNDITHQGLSAQLADNSMVRVYNALCVGNIKRDKIKIDAPIGRHPINRKKMMSFRDSERSERFPSRIRDSERSTDTKRRARHAVTYVEVLERFGKHTLISAKLETGRTHQIRVHMAHIGHPVLGDTVYGGGSPSFAGQGQVLHAAEIAFIHPVTGKTMTFTAPRPQYFTNAVGKVYSHLI